LNGFRTSFMHTTCPQISLTLLKSLRNVRWILWIMKLLSFNFKYDKSFSYLLSLRTLFSNATYLCCVLSKRRLMWTFLVTKLCINYITQYKNPWICVFVQGRFFFDPECQQPSFIAQRAQEPWRSFLSN
jgi:hypothetical protein